MSDSNGDVKRDTGAMFTVDKNIDAQLYLHFRRKGKSKRIAVVTG